MPSEKFWKYTTISLFLVLLGEGAVSAYPNDPRIITGPRVSAALQWLEASSDPEHQRQYDGVVDAVLEHAIDRAEISGRFERTDSSMDGVRWRCISQQPEFDDFVESNDPERLFDPWLPQPPEQGHGL